MANGAVPVRFHSVERGRGRPVLVLHGGHVDHREAEACFEPALDGGGGSSPRFPDRPTPVPRWSARGGWTRRSGTRPRRSTPAPCRTPRRPWSTTPALPHEQPGLLRASFADWLTRVERAGA